MKIIKSAFRSINEAVSLSFPRPIIVRSLSTNAEPESFESVDDFERRMFGGYSGNNASSDSFFQKLDRLGKASNGPGTRMGMHGDSTLDGLDESFNTLSDGMDGKLKKAATYFEYDPEEVSKDDYAFRPDVSFRDGMTYDTKDLDLTKRGVRKPARRTEFEVTTEEVLRKADFRNVRFLANFITEAGIIIKRSKTGISAKAQRKVAREIKTARAFGLLPFTTMGSKSFVFGKTMEDLDEDYQYESFDSQIGDDPIGKDPLGP